MSDFAVMEKHIVSKLRAWPSLAGVRVVQAPAPPDFVEGIVFKCLTPEADTVPAGKDRIQSQALYLVVAQTESEDISSTTALVRGIDSALHDTGGTYPHVGSVYFCERLRGYNMPVQSEGGRKRQQVGSIFRLSAIGTPEEI